MRRPPLKGAGAKLDDASSDRVKVIRPWIVDEACERGRLDQIYADTSCCKNVDRNVRHFRMYTVSVLDPRQVIEQHPHEPQSVSGKISVTLSNQLTPLTSAAQLQEGAAAGGRRLVGTCPVCHHWQDQPWRNSGPGDADNSATVLVRYCPLVHATLSICSR